MEQTGMKMCSYRDCDPDANVLLYIDNSNMFESAKKYSGHKKKFINDTPDFLCRIDIGKLIAMAVGGRGVLVGKLYGSEPPALDTVWDAIRKKKVLVETFHRSKLTGKEKELDTSLVADAVADIIMQKDQAGEKRTIILFSGDRDLLAVVRHALAHGYTVEIWSFRFSMSRDVLGKCSDKLKVNYIDEIFNKVTYTQSVWSHPTFPMDKSIVATLNLPSDLPKIKFFRQFVEKSWSIFALPMMGKYIKNFAHIVLVPCIRLRRKENCNFDFYKHIQPYMHVLKEHFGSYCTEVISLKEFLDRSRETASDSMLQLQNRYQQLQLNSDDDDDDDDEDDFFDNHCIPTTEFEEILELEEDLDVSYDSEGFQAICRNKVKQKKNLYSKACSRKFWCWKGLNCDYKHAEEEREFFKINKDIKRRKFYKIKPCYYRECKYRNKSYLCPYAHSVQEARCILCGEVEETEKHWMDQCPKNNSQDNPEK